MDVYFKTQRGSSFCIELGYWDTVLEIKKKIEKYQRIPVSKQTLLFQGNVLQDHLDIEQCKILHRSRITVLFSNDQVLQPEQSPAPSKPTGDSQVSVVKNNDQSQPSDAAKQISNGIQELTVTAQTKESAPSSNAVNENVNVQDSTVTVQREESLSSSNAVNENSSNIKDSTVTLQVPQTEKSQESNSVKEITKIQDSTLDLTLSL